MRVSEGTRTPDRRDHNPELYQLSYAHRGGLNLATQPSTLPGHAASRDIAYVRMIWPLEEEKAMANSASDDISSDLRRDQVTMADFWKDG
jgi:hypothetical protein